VIRSQLLIRVAAGALPVILVFAVYLLLRGHDAPGGGFIAGLVTSVAAVLSALAFGLNGALRCLAPVVRRMLWIGLLVAAASGLVSVAHGDAYFTHYHVQIGVTEHLALYLSTALLFDVAVYAVVVGAAITMLGAFAAESP
jgi:multicomponent Na+:H+ antiporter subunit B